MGYCTQYSLEIHQGKTDLITDEEHMEMIYKEAGYDKWLFDGEPCKWYGYHKQMGEYSSKFPETVFKLRGEGEDSGDFWITYYLNGKSQECKAKIIYEKFDKSKLI